MPPNTTSLIQPLDRGIIHSFKKNYKTTLLNRILCSGDNLIEPIYKNINLFEAFEKVSSAWNFVTSKTIINCFKVLNDHNDTNDTHHNHNNNDNHKSNDEDDNNDNFKEIS